MDAKSRAGRTGVRAGLAGGIAVAAFLLVSWSDGHYWDEFFYLYSALAHSPTELVRYELSTVLFPVGFFSEKIGHVVLLRALTVAFGSGVGVVYFIQAVYALLLLGFLAAAYYLLRELVGQTRAREAAVVLAFSPLTLYLWFKVMSEVPSLFLTTLGSWAFVRAFRPGSRGRTLTWLAVATVGLAAGMLCRFTAVIAFAGLGLALLIVGDQRFERRLLLSRLVAVGIAVALLQAGGLALAGGSPLRFGGHIYSVVTSHPPLQRVYALALFVQALVLVLPFAWTARAELGTRLGSVWFAASAFPFLAGHEPRYYAPALVPLALIGAAGLREAGRFLFKGRVQYGWVGLLAALALVNRALLIPLMPYEVDQNRLIGLFRNYQARAPDATYLIPWASDYSLLRFAFPASHIELCLSATSGSRYHLPADEGKLAEADQWWAGAGHHVESRLALADEPRPWYYIGWTYSPPTLRLQRMLIALGLERLIRKMPQRHNHLAGSWIWYDNSLVLRPQTRLAQYYVYEVSPRDRAVAAARQ